jgi:hypothetical protein
MGAAIVIVVSALLVLVFIAVLIRGRGVEAAADHEDGRGQRVEPVERGYAAPADAGAEDQAV